MRETLKEKTNKSTLTSSKTINWVTCNQPWPFPSFSSNLVLMQAPGLRQIEQKKQLSISPSAISPLNTTKVTFHPILIILSFQGSRKSLNFAVTPSPIMADMILVFTKTAWRKIYGIYAIFLSFCPLVIAKVIWDLGWHWARRIRNLPWLFQVNGLGKLSFTF